MTNPTPSCAAGTAAHASTFPCMDVGGIRAGGSLGGWETWGTLLPSQRTLLMLLGRQRARCPRDPVLPGVWWPGMHSALAEVGVTWPAGSITP